MRMREVEYQGKKSLLVYLTEEEKDEYEAMLPKWNQNYESVVSYLSGDRDMKAVLKQIVTNHAS